MKRFLFRYAVIFAAAFAVAGCGTLAPELPKIPFQPKEEEVPGPCCSVGGKPLKIDFAPNGQFMAILYAPEIFSETRQFHAERAVSGRLALFNTEFETPFPVDERLAESIESPKSFAFWSDSLLIAAETGPDQANVFRVPHANKKDGLKPLFSEPKPYRDFLLSPRGDWFGGCTQDGRWEITDTKEPARTVVFPPSEKTPLPGMTVVRILDFSPDGELVATLMVGADRTDSTVKTIAIWDLKVARSVPLSDVKEPPLQALFVASLNLKEKEPVPLGTFSPDGQQIAFRTKSRYVGIWQTASGRLLSEFGEHRQRVASLAFSPSSNQLAVGLEESHGRIVLWDVRKGTILRSRENPVQNEDAVRTMAFEPDGRFIRYGNARGEIGEWNIRENIEKKKP